MDDPKGRWFVVDNEANRMEVTEPFGKLTYTFDERDRLMSVVNLATHLVSRV